MPLPQPDALALDSIYLYRTHRDPLLYAGGEFRLPALPAEPALVYGWMSMHPVTGEDFRGDQLALGSGFFYPLHFRLDIPWGDLGSWIVGFAAIAMMAALVSGVVIHRKIFREFFTFRPGKHIQRSTLDLHNMSGVLALPFHFVFAFTGLLIFAEIYLPAADGALRPVASAYAHRHADLAGLPSERTGTPGPLASVDAMVRVAEQHWAERGEPATAGMLAIKNLGDRNAVVSITPEGADRVPREGRALHFRAADGTVIGEDPPASAVGATTGFLTGLHFIRFRHWPLRWLFFGGGMLGCVCLATGFIFFVEKRKKRHAKTGEQGSRTVDALAVAAVTGMLIATASILLANRVLPADAAKGALEKAVFWGAWMLALLHAWWRGAAVVRAAINPAWREQCLAVAALAVVAVLCNWVSTGDHLLATSVLRPNWAIAGIDLGMLCAAGLATLAAHRLALRERPGLALAATS